jgi:hypothetical protein
MAQNYTQQSHTAQSCAEQGYSASVTARRNAVAILAIAPLAAAISVSPAPQSDVEKLEARLVVMRRNGLVRMHVSWCPKGAAMTAEEHAGVLPNALDAPRIESG